MTRYTKGTRVVAVKDIRRFWNDTVTKGSPGVVTEGGFLNRAQVKFWVRDALSLTTLLSDSTVLVDVDDDEIEFA